MRVTNWQRWQRTKIIVAGALFVISMFCFSGLEKPEPFEPMRSFTGCIISMTLCLLLTINIAKKGTK